MTIRITSHAMDRAAERLVRIYQIHSHAGEAFNVWFRRAAESAYGKCTQWRRSTGFVSHLGAEWRFVVDGPNAYLLTVMPYGKWKMRIRGRFKQRQTGQRPRFDSNGGDEDS